MVSARALKVAAPNSLSGFGHQEGTRPQRMRTTSRLPFCSVWQKLMRAPSGRAPGVIDVRLIFSGTRVCPKSVDGVDFGRKNFVIACRKPRGVSDLETQASG
jgi:hypothetical protein